MKLTIQLDQGAGAESVTIGPRAQVAWERRTKSKLSELSKAMGMDDLAFLAYCQLGYEQRRDASQTYDQWLAQLADLDVEGAAADPT